MAQIEGSLLKDIEEFLELMGSLEPDIVAQCPHCEEELSMYIGDCFEAYDERRLALLEKIRAELYRGGKE